ncbi:MAG TPA: NADH-quinone oxidoreductase subunit M, partial [Gammaproteobacteria bacterium]|nr:NADH-quinone oxidoreductase subunit M [Gammaproteobacteria bacterium]
ALVVSLLGVAISFIIYGQFDLQLAGMQLQEKHAWIPYFNIYYALGVDGIALPLIILTSISTFLVVIASFWAIQKNVSSYLAIFLMMNGFICGVFAATDAVLFYVFWEAMLIPMFLLIGIWGGENRIYATLKFFLYTFLGSIVMLVALLYLYWVSDSAQIADFYDLGLTANTQMWLFIAFLLAFAVKIPMFPVHTWLPDAHVEAPTGGSVILAAVMLKIGAYGFLRFSLPITPLAGAALADLMIVLSLIAVVYIGVVAIMQKDLKKLIAYSSIAHMGFATLGIFMVFPLLDNAKDLAAAVLAVEGAMIQLVSHGFISAALFFCVGVLYERMHTRSITDFGGVANVMPVFAGFFMLFSLANVGLPGTSGFVGELFVILSAVKVHFLVALFAGLTLILSPAYTLWMYKRTLFGSMENQQVKELTDITWGERLIFAVLAFLVIGLGVWPAPLIEIMHASIVHLLTPLS